jgi:hypothetical protein
MPRRLLHLHESVELVSDATGRAFGASSAFQYAVVRYRAGAWVDECATELLPWVEAPRARRLIERYIAVAGSEMERIEKRRPPIGRHTDLDWQVLPPRIHDEAWEHAVRTIRDLGHTPIYPASAPPHVDRERAPHLAREAQALELLERALRGTCLADGCPADVASRGQVPGVRPRRASRPFLCAEHAEGWGRDEWIKRRNRVTKLLNDVESFVTRNDLEWTTRARPSARAANR